MLLSKYLTDTGDQRSYQVAYYNSGGTKTLNFSGSTDGSSSFGYNIAQTLNDGTWYHIACVYTSGGSPKVEFFINGSSIGSTTSSLGASLFNSTATFNIGSNSDGTKGQFADGQFDDVRVWNVVRSEAQIAANYQIELTGTESGLVAYYPFEVLTPAAVGGGIKMTTNTRFWGF